jgi:hypothetical protein
MMTTWPVFSWGSIVAKRHAMMSPRRASVSKSILRQPPEESGVREAKKSKYS